MLQSKRPPCLRTLRDLTMRGTFVYTAQWVYLRVQRFLEGLDRLVLSEEKNKIGLKSGGFKWICKKA